MNELALFAGIGGGILGGDLLGWTTVAAVEKEPFCREVLLRRQRDGLLPLFPIWDDVLTFDGRPWRGIVDVISAGFPCQPFSIANAKRRKGRDDERNLWPETRRILGEVEPHRALLENVPGLLRTDYFGEILGDLAEMGYNAAWGIVSAKECGAPHQRKRLWILCHKNVPYSNDEPLGVEQEPGKKLSATSNPRYYGPTRPMAYSDGVGIGWRSKSEGDAKSYELTAWAVEPDVGRVADGVPFRVDRLRALGNAQVPSVAAIAWIILWERLNGYLQNSDVPSRYDRQ
jgi:DNA (cytosine-5)-methyltransferase 1